MLRILALTFEIEPDVLGTSWDNIGRGRFALVEGLSDQIMMAFSLKKCWLNR